MFGCKLRGSRLAEENLGVISGDSISTADVWYLTNYNSVPRLFLQSEFLKRRRWSPSAELAVVLSFSLLARSAHFLTFGRILLCERATAGRLHMVKERKLLSCKCTPSPFSQLPLLLSLFSLSPSQSVLFVPGTYQPRGRGGGEKGEG